MRRLLGLVLAAGLFGGGVALGRYGLPASGGSARLDRRPGSTEAEPVSATVGGKAWTTASLGAALADRALLADEEERSAVLDALGQFADPGDAAQLLAAAMRLPMELRSAACDRILTRWTEQQPEAAASYASSLVAPWAQRSALMTVLQTWSASDADAAASWLERQPPGPMRTEGAELVLMTIARDDPDRAADLAKLLPGARGANALGQVVGAKAVDDPDGARELFESLPAGYARTGALRALADTLAQRSPEEALAWAKTLPQAEADVVVGTAIHSFAAADPERAAQAIVQLDSAAQDGRWSVVAQSWVTTDPKALLEFARGLPPGSVQTDALRGLTLGAADLDPEVGKQLLDLIPASDSGRSDCARTVARALGSRDPQAALRWVGGLDASTQKQARADVLMSWMQEDPKAAASALDELAPDERSELLEPLAASWSVIDGAAAVAWAEKLPAGEPRDRALSGAIASLVEYDPRRALELADKLPQGVVSLEAKALVAGRWAESEPAAALDWAASVQGEEGEPALVAAVAAVNLRGRERVLAWIEDQRGPTKDRALATLGSQLAYDEPAAALDLVLRMERGTRRDAALREVGGQWLQRDEESAAAWLREHGLAPETLVPPISESSGGDDDGASVLGRHCTCD